MNRINTFKLMSGYFLYECGRAMYFVLVTWFLYQWTEDAIYTGLFVSFGFVPGLFSNLIFGVLVDRYNRKRLASISGAVSTAILALLLLSFKFSWVTAWWVILTHMLLQTCGSLFRPSLQALVAEVFDEKELPKIFSLSGSATISGSLAGAMLGGLFSTFAAMPLSLTLVILLYSVAFLSVVLLDYSPISRQKKQSGSFFKEMGEGFSFLSTNRMLYGLFVMLMIGQLTFHTTLGFLSVYTSEFLQRSSVIYGALDMTFSIGGIAAGLLGAWWWKRMENHLAVYSLAAMAAGLLIMSLTKSLTAAFAGILLVGLGTSFVRALLQSVQQIATPKELQGRMASLRMLCNQSSVVITGPVFGLIARNYGADRVFLTLLIPVLLGFVWSLLQSRHPQFIKITSHKSA
ncbi:MFS transporter [Halobacillus massiliensis]|uniref:MFS transporter n=1 Tax=Halobacillus massiliensis TaxID=1926286 RepID=UPI0009E48C1B|nr:MFS transporter [Halobacillus massiliensis]